MRTDTESITANAVVILVKRKLSELGRSVYDTTISRYGILRHAGFQRAWTVDYQDHPVNEHAIQTYPNARVSSSPLHR